MCCSFRILKPKLLWASTDPQSEIPATLHGARHKGLHGEGLNRASTGPQQGVNRASTGRQEGLERASRTEVNMPHVWMASTGPGQGLDRARCTGPCSVDAGTVGPVAERYSVWRLPPQKESQSTLNLK